MVDKKDVGRTTASRRTAPAPTPSPSSLAGRKCADQAVSRTSTTWPSKTARRCARPEPATTGEAAALADASAPTASLFAVRRARPPAWRREDTLAYDLQACRGVETQRSMEGRRPDQSLPDLGRRLQQGKTAIYADADRHEQAPDHPPTPGPVDPAHGDQRDRSSGDDVSGRQFGLDACVPAQWRGAAASRSPPQRLKPAACKEDTSMATTIPTNPARPVGLWPAPLLPARERRAGHLFR